MELKGLSLSSIKQSLKPMNTNVSKKCHFSGYPFLYAFVKQGEVGGQPFIGAASLSEKTRLPGTRISNISIIDTTPKVSKSTVPCS